ncbi:unnamed protein product [Rhizophagus irregularis]|nr:unnamed protein product [Rhizophagus irregularis]
MGMTYRKTYAFHDLLTQNDGTMASRTLITYSNHQPIPHPTKKQLARQQRHKALLTYKHKSLRHIVPTDILNSSVWMTTKEPAIVIPLLPTN